ncbi:hypothetical protein [Sulfurimonas sp.]|uniref:hypothetical protein n=1 Tax=Sulfurimonas sp. TaxID=2022749 RepID=UPI003D0BFCE7
MKKIVLSSLAALTLGSVALSASDVKLYQDANGQVFTVAGEGRTEIKSDTSVFSHADKLKFSGLTYLGYTYNDLKSTDSTGAALQDEGGFEIRRGYFQLKAYLLDDPKSYFRVTYDLNHESGGDVNVRAKYAYLFLNEVLPATGLEVGLVHRPWHDYEEHNSWYFRDISEVLIESKRNGDLSNSADFGAMLKTRTQYFDADYGLFNGEGYHGTQAGTDMSFEWRATAHILGVDGKDAQNKKTYFDASFFGQLNTKYKGNDNLEFFGLHTVYNQPAFLVSAQYVSSKNTANDASYVSAKSGSGYSVNGEYRIGDDKQYRFLGRYDSWTPEVVSGAKEYEKTSYIAGFAWDQNRNVQWVANVIVSDNEDDSTGNGYSSDNGTAYMLTAQVEF